MIRASETGFFFIEGFALFTHISEVATPTLPLHLFPYRFLPPIFPPSIAIVT